MREQFEGEAREPQPCSGPASCLAAAAGDVSPAAALDALATQGNTVLVDIRSAKEKEAAGVPDLPNNGEKGLAGCIAVCRLAQCGG